MRKSAERKMLAVMVETEESTNSSVPWHPVRLASIIVALATGLATTSPAFAEGRDAKERAAKLACLSGDYAQGVQLLNELFVDSDDPTYVYNQGRCYEQNRRYDDAIARFQEYLRAAKKISKADKADTQKHIRDCKELLASEPSAPPSPTPPPPAPGPTAQPIPADTLTGSTSEPAPPKDPIAIHQTKDTGAQTGSGLRAAGIIAASVGGAGLLAGVVFNLKANSLASQIKKTDGYSASKVSDRKSYETMGWIGYGVGAACVATGVVLYALGLRSSEASTVAVAPALAPGQAWLVAKGAF